MKPGPSCTFVVQRFFRAYRQTEAPCPLPMLAAGGGQLKASKSGKFPSPPRVFNPTEWLTLATTGNKIWRDFSLHTRVSWISAVSRFSVSLRSF